MSPAKHSSASVTDGRTDRRTDRQTTDKVIPMCRYASQATQMLRRRHKNGVEDIGKHLERIEGERNDRQSKRILTSLSLNALQWVSTEDSWM